MTYIESVRRKGLGLDGFGDGDGESSFCSFALILICCPRLEARKGWAAEKRRNSLETLGLQ
jgi:hypothetical protein